MLRKLMVFLLISALIFSLAGCKGSKAENTPAGQASAQVSAEPTAKAKYYPFLKEAESVEYAFDIEEITTPFWYGNVMYNEMFKLVDYGNEISSQILFAPVKVVSVRDYALKKEYVEGVDYIVEGNKIIRLEGSSMPYLSENDAKMPYADIVWSKNEDANINITYVYNPEDWTYEAIKYKGDLLPKTVEKLADTERPFNLCTYGDSITYGWASSGAQGINREPKLMIYPRQIQKALAAHRNGGRVNLRNPSVGGWSTVDGLANVQKVYERYVPDLVTLSFGVNDANIKLSKQQVVDNLKKMMRNIREHAPDVEFIIIVPVYPNPVGVPNVKDFYFSEAYAQLEGPGVAVVDMCQMQEELLKVKKYVDVSGDNSCHPNDFCMRIYTMGVLSTIIDYEKK